MIDDGKKTWLNTVLCRIQGVSDKAYQRRVWINGIGPECDDFDETSEYIICDMRDILKEHHLFGMTEYQYHLLNKFRDEYENFCYQDLSYHGPERFIDTPEWTRITELAEEVIKAFDYHYVFPSTR